MINPFHDIEDAQTLAKAIVNTIHEPFLVMDAQFRVMAACRSFYETFKVDPEQTHGHLLYALGDGQWDIPALRVLLETIIRGKNRDERFRGRSRFPRGRPPHHAAECAESALRGQFDNGIGKSAADPAVAGSGLGTIIVKALVSQLDARMEAADPAEGHSVSIARATFISRIPRAA